VTEATGLSDLQGPAGNTYDKYGTRNPVARFLVERFLRGVEEAVAEARPESVLDVGCGLGALLRRAREEGHTGRLCGIDPDHAALEVARRRGDVDWIEATAASMTFDREFELAVMTGHAFQVLVDDEELDGAPSALGAASRSRRGIRQRGRGNGGRSWRTKPSIRTAGPFE
jgi:ubiquinone/menaquinone biosynthesis C-methylase UbiE